MHFCQLLHHYALPMIYITYNSILHDRNWLCAFHKIIIIEAILYHNNNMATNILYILENVVFPGKLSKYKQLWVIFGNVYNIENVECISLKLSKYLVSPCPNPNDLKWVICWLPWQRFHSNYTKNYILMNLNHLYHQ